MINSKLLLFHYTNEILTKESEYLLSLLDASSVKRVQSYVHAADRDRSLIGEYLAKSLLSSQFSKEIKKIKFKRNKYGKPFWDEESDVHFNISHSGSWIIVGVSSLPIGVDIEQIRPIEKSVYSHVLTKNEIAQIENLPSASQNSSFFRYWTMKESYMKAIGKGFSLSPLSFELDLSESPVKWEGDRQCGVPSIMEYFVDHEYCCSVSVLEGDTPQEIAIIGTDDIFFKLL